MKNFQNYKAAKYADTEKYTEVEDGIYLTKNPDGTDGDYVTSLTFELELDDPIEEDGTPEYPPQTPFEDLLDEFMVYVSDFYEELNKASEVTCYQEFGSPELEDIQKLRTIIGKRFYAVENPDDDRYYIIKIADMSEPRVYETKTEEAPDYPDNEEDNDSPAITITETNVKDFEFEYREGYGGVITEYLGSDKAVVIPAEINGKPVRAIGGEAFANRENLESAVISDGIQVLGWDAFSGCKKLKNITIPESVTAFMGRVFAGTPWLNKKRKENPLVIVNGLLIDGIKCEGDVVIPKGVKEVVSDAFCNCRGITSVSIPDGVTEIGHRAFQVCKQLTSVTLPSSVKMIGEWAFEDCKKLENLNFPDGVEELGDSAFNGTPWLENKRKETPLLIIGKYLLDGRGCKGEVEIPEGVTHICPKAFYYNRELTSVVFPESVTMIDRYAFQGCSALENVKLVYGLTTIREGAFSGCAALEELDFPRTLAEIEEGAFRNCESLKEVDLPNEELRTIASGTFSGCTSLDHIYIHDCVTKIEKAAFKECASMRWARLPDDLKTIPCDCFQGCTSLEEADIPSGLEVIEQHAFKGCTALKSVGIPDSVTEIGIAAFMDCAALEKVYLSEGLSEISDYTFANCRALKEVHFEDRLRSIGTSAFHGCYALEELDLPDTLEQISDLAFAGCYSLEEIEIPDSVEELDPTTFRSCSCTVKYKGEEFSFSIELTKSVKELYNEDMIAVDIFGRATAVRVISTGDNQFDENGQYKPDGFALSEKEIAVLNDFLENVKIADFIEEITDYCNERYEEEDEEQISEDETPREIKITTIVINVCKDNGEDDPEIAFMGDCYCDDEGICIGFREGKLVGIEQQDWLL